MKKLIALSVIFICLVLASCGSDEESTTRNIGYGTHPYIDPLATTENGDDTTDEDGNGNKDASLSEMSPSSTDVTFPEDVAVKVSDIDFDSFEEIDAEDSVLSDVGHDKVLDSGKAQYFFVRDDIKVHAIFFEDSEAEKRVVSGSASYNTETGFIEFYGDADKSWYFDEDGQLRCVVYTFSFGTGTPAIYTFYTPEGVKEVTRTYDGWYSPEYDLLTNEEIAQYLQKYEGVIEATSEYDSTAVIGGFTG